MPNTTGKAVPESGFFCAHFVNGFVNGFERKTAFPAQNERTGMTPTQLSHNVIIFME